MLRSDFFREQNRIKESLMLRKLMLAAMVFTLPLLAGCQPPGSGTSTGTGAAGGGGGGTDILMSILPLILIFVVFYFLLIRPQQRKQKAHREMLGNVKRGDNIVTTGGMIGTVIKVDRDDNLLVEVAPNIRIKIMRSAIAEIVRRPEPARASGDADEPDEEEAEERSEGKSGQAGGAAPSTGAPRNERPS
jgi:preprotein translocase subunit YajC